MPIKILSASQIRAIDAYSIEHEPISSINLMERASRAFVDAFEKEVSFTNRITVFAGTGNNGGDAFAIARLLFKKGYPVKVFFVKNPEANLSPDCNENMWRWRNLPEAHFKEISKEVDLQCIDCGDVVVDGLFGSGLNRPLSGLYEAAVKKINEHDLPVYSVDIPSGLFVEDNRERRGGAVVQAKKIYSFQFSKLAFLLPENGVYVPQFEVLDIGLSSKAIEDAETNYFFLQKEDIRKLLHTRERFSHKGTFGHAFLVAGQYAKMGAAVIASKACLRAGVGLLTVHCPKSGVDVLQIAVPEAMVDVDMDENENSELIYLSPKHTVGIGPGIGKGKKVRKMLEKLLRESEKPVVVDADALNLLSEHRELIELLPQNSILTPHPTEFERLAGEKFDSGYDRLLSAKKMAKKWHVVIVLKGAYTAVVLPSGRVYFNPTGNPGMATAGSGDCLTGIITGLLAQGYSPDEASLVGVFVHGLAGDLALERVFSMESLIASDIIEMIGHAFLTIQQ
jgi:ADP-dependent NAD(P)H-hydrate dehydratase / NAD(P)H-hydrate epimerase